MTQTVLWWQRLPQPPRVAEEFFRPTQISRASHPVVGAVSLFISDVRVSAAKSYSPCAF